MYNCKCIPFKKIKKLEAKHSLKKDKDHLMKTLLKKNRTLAESKKNETLEEKHSYTVHERNTP